MQLDEVTDEMADAASAAMHEFMWGTEEPPSRRDLGIIRQAMKVAIAAALEVREDTNAG